MNVILFLFLFVGACASEKLLLCYYGSWATYRVGLGKFDVSNIDPHLCSHVIYTFVGINSDGEIISVDPYLDLPDNYGRDNFRKLNALKKINPKLKTLLSVGGYNEGSAKYSEMAANANKRKKFITTAINMIQKYGFDGLDISWEYPNRGDSVHGQADINNLTQLLKELRQAFDKHGLLVTAAVTASQDLASLSYNVSGISKHLDLINVMAYDFNGAYDITTGHNSPLHRGEGDEMVLDKYLHTVDASLKWWLSQGSPREKLVLGVPFYGHTYKLRDPKNNGVRAPSRGPGIAGPYTQMAGNIGYNELCHKFIQETWKIRSDEKAKVPYAVQGENWVSFDNVTSITAKVKHALTLDIAGIMVWSIETDDFRGICRNERYPLLRAINNALGRTIVKPNGTRPGAPASTEATTPQEETFVCQEAGLTADPTDCAAFYMCIRDVNGELVPNLLKCPGDLLWDQENLFCNYPDQVQCEAH